MRLSVRAIAAVLVSLSSMACRAGYTTASGRGAILAAPEVTAGEPDARTLLGDLPAHASSLGAGPPSVVAAGPAVDNEWVGGFVSVPRDACLLAYARASISVEDVDVAVYSDEGASLAIDDGRDVHPTVLLCPPHPDRVYVVAHVVEGEGLVAAAAQLVPRDRSTAIARALGARDEGQSPRAADAWPGLADAVRDHRSALGGRWEDVKRVALPVDERAPTFVSMPIEADGCLDAMVVPDDDVELLDVEVLDAHAQVIARAKDGVGPRGVTVCSPMSVAATLLVRPHVGHGLAAVVLARAPFDSASDFTSRPEVAWAAAVQPLDAARSARNAVLAKVGYGGPATTSSGTLALERRAVVPLDLQSLGPGACARVDVVAGSPLALLDARVWSDSGTQLAAAESASSLALFDCARAPARLELEARGRPGPFSVLIRPEPWRDAAFTARPVAASRMLARASSGPEALLKGVPSSARAVALEAGQRVTWSENLAAGKCVRVTVGVQGEGSGVDLRAFDATDDDLDRGHGAHAASIRACAGPDTARIVRFELRGTAGHLEAVVGERLEASDAR